MTQTVAPHIPDLRFQNFTNDFGVDSLHYEGPNGSHIQLSDYGVERLDDPSFQDILGQSIEAVALHKDPRSLNIRELPDGAQVHKIAGLHGNVRNMSSIYGLRDYIVKSGLDKNEGPIQFGTMNWLHDRLPAVSNRVSAPAQFALLTTFDNLPTTIMETAVGTTLQKAVHPLFNMVQPGNAARIRSETVTDVKDALWKAIGETAYKALLNDIDQHGHVSNIIVNGAPGSKSSLLSVIDQPSFTTLKDRLLVPRAYNHLKRAHHKKTA